MTAYRDQYASLFNGGRNVVLVGISVDPPEEMHAWAADADFPFLFASDPDGSTYASYGGDLRRNNMPGSRSVVVVDPEGRIAEVLPRFREVDPTAYEELAAIVDRVAPPPEDEG